MLSEAKAGLTGKSDDGIRQADLFVVQPPALAPEQDASAQLRRLCIACSVSCRLDRPAHGLLAVTVARSGGKTKLRSAMAAGKIVKNLHAFDDMHGFGRRDARPFRWASPRAG